ncbi:MAG: AAA family ATPase [Myxococcota bacterium]|jgi:exodeoxyribonuclease V alpha subunit
MKKCKRDGLAHPTEASIEIRGRVEHLFFSGPTFSAGVLKDDFGDTIRFAGKLMVQAGESVVMHGTWERTKYGDQIKVTSFEYNIPLDPSGLAGYIANNPRIKGIGPAKAKMIVETFGGGFERALEDHPEDVAKVAKVPLAVIEALRDEWARTRSFNLANTWLASFELTHHQVTTLVKKYGNSVIAVFKADPYQLIREIQGYGFKRVDKIARKMGTAKDGLSRIKAGIGACVNEALDDGHCWTACEDLVEQANTLLVMDTLDSREKIEDALDRLIEEKELATDHIDGRFLVSLPYIKRMETDLAEIFKRGGELNPHFKDGPNKHTQYLPSELNGGQRRAVVNSLIYSITVITGGAGSGKTYTVKTLCDIYEREKKAVLLCAPTGKAAKRMEESTGRSAMTIHRLLEYNGQEFQFEGPITADLLVVDEVSMVDVPLFWHLLRAVDLSKTAVVLVGDHNQLPPVGPGNVLRDLIATKAVPVSTLDLVVRQAGILKENCSAILKGTVPPSSPVDTVGLRAWYRFTEFTEAEELLVFIRALYQAKLHDELQLDLISDVQLLSPTRKGPLGVNSLNIELQRLIQKKLYGVDVPVTPANHRPRHLLHDKVIQRRNNYSLGVMNGSVGQVVGVSTKTGDLTVRFDGRDVMLVKSDGHLADIDLAYCLTIHQVQGSEFPVALVVCHKSHSYQHHRNLLYTGVTRAKRSAVILGDAWGVRNCATKIETNKRRTWLSLIEGRR